jgi:hypothetical protein
MLPTLTPLDAVNVNIPEVNFQAHDYLSIQYQIAELQEQSEIHLKQRKKVTSVESDLIILVEVN